MRVRITPGTVIGSLALFTALSGTAVAATGGTFLLGKSNSATSVTSLTNSKGTALVLHSKSGTPAFTVGGNRKQIPSLNASLLGGYGAAALQTRMKVYATHGSFSLTVPSGFHHLLVNAVGAGGGGGGEDTADSSGGSGGGQGGNVSVWIVAKPGAKFVVQVGAGGGAGGSNANGADGTASLMYKSGGSASSPLFAAGGGSRGSVGNSSCNTTGGSGGQANGPLNAGATAITTATSGSNGQPGGDALNGGLFCVGGSGGGGTQAIPGGGGFGGSAFGSAHAGADGAVVVQFVA